MHADNLLTRELTGSGSPGFRFIVFKQLDVGVDQLLPHDFISNSLSKLVQMQSVKQ